MNHTNSSIYTDPTPLIDNLENNYTGLILTY